MSTDAIVLLKDDHKEITQGSSATSRRPATNAHAAKGTARRARSSSC